MLAKYAVFTVITSVISFWCMQQVQEPYYKHINDFYNTFCIYLSKKVNDFLSSRNILTCVAAAENEELFQEEESDILFTADMLNKYSENSEKLYLSILGEVFDVTKGKKFYGPGEGYHGFTGKDGSRAFVTGDFTEKGLIDDVLDLSLQDIKSLSDWSKFYHKEYEYKGKLIGRYYNSDGRPTGYYYKLQKKLVEAAKAQTVSDEFKLNYPPCNVEFDINTGSRVWCSTRSGGIERDWVGVPRKIYEPGSKTHRCACLNIMGQSTEADRNTRIKNIEEYEDCHPEATSCHVHM
ncbi:neuferricin [Lycorma delicatula]|uniref:neuferricin n=1 Tax=Lycorma delicatula TaxID=130591 RepID=UPI003F510D9C